MVKLMRFSMESISSRPPASMLLRHDHEDEPQVDHEEDVNRQEGSKECVLEQAEEGFGQVLLVDNCTSKV